jgi:hypothetical protein
MLINPFRFGVAPPPVLGNGSWIELGRDTLGAPASEMDVTGLANKKYLMYLYNTTGAGAGIVNGRMIFNNNFTADYAIRFSTNGAADSTQTLQSDGIDIDITGNTTPKFSFGVIANFLNRQKLAQCWNNDVNTTGAGNAPQRREVVGKMDITTSGAVIDRITFRTTVNTYLAGSEAVVLGWDADSDTHNTSANFWQPLADVVLTGTADDMNVTIPARKWLFMQCYEIPTGGTTSHRIRINGRTGSTWSTRQNVNDTESIIASTTAVFPVTTDALPKYWYAFVNNPSQSVERNIQLFGCNFPTGAASAPTPRRDTIGKETLTSQITSIELENSGTGSYDVGSFFRVWGAD